MGDAKAHNRADTLKALTHTALISPSTVALMSTPLLIGFALKPSWSSVKVVESYARGSKALEAFKARVRVYIYIYIYLYIKI